MLRPALSHAKAVHSCLSVCLSVCPSVCLSVPVVHWCISANIEVSAELGRLGASVHEDTIHARVRPLLWKIISDSCHPHVPQWRLRAATRCIKPPFSSHSGFFSPRAPTGTQTRLSNFLHFCSMTQPRLSHFIIFCSLLVLSICIPCKHV